MHRLELIGVEGMPEVRPKDDIVVLLIKSLKRQSLELRSRDVLVITHKIVSKAEGRLVKLADVAPSQFAVKVARTTGKDSRLVELVLSESKRIVRMARGVIIAETRHGFVCANAGVDQSNVEHGYASLLPVNPDRSARHIRRRIEKELGVDVAVIISDTFGRPWREGQTDVAVGVAGIEPLKDYRGQKDPYGYELKVTSLAVVDEMASAAELVMGKLERVPIVILRGYSFQLSEGFSRKLVRRPSRDLFR